MLTVCKVSGDAVIQNKPPLPGDQIIMFYGIQGETSMCTAVLE